MRRTIGAYSFVWFLLSGVALVMVFVVAGRGRCWTLADPNKEGFWLLFAAILGVVTFANERVENLANRRTEIQLEFFSRWQKLRSRIEKIPPEGNPDRAAVLFRRYFELLSLEYSMQAHVSWRIWKDWCEFRKNDFKEETVYGGKTYSQWWDEVGARLANKNFTKFMDKCRESRPASSQPVERTDSTGRSPASR